MNRSDLKSLGNELQQLRRELHADLCAQLMSVVKSGSGEPVDALPELRHAVATLGSGPQMALLRELERVDAALQRMADGSYGICPECGEEIELNRLRADPAARQCIACVTQHQRSVVRS